MDVDALADRLRRTLRDDPSAPRAAWLFGSLARGEGHADSDADVAVLFGEPPPATLCGGGLALEGRLESSMAMSIDLIVLDDAPVDLIHRVLRDGQLLYDDDPSLRVRFEIRSRNAYFDLLPYLREYRGTAGGRAP